MAPLFQGQCNPSNPQLETEFSAILEVDTLQILI